MPPGETASEERGERRERGAGERVRRTERESSMYRRYSEVRETNVPVSQMRRNRVKNLIILLLAAALIALAAVALPAMQSRASARGLFIQRMQNEIATAVRLAPSLSRNAGASSAAILAQIRSNIYAIAEANDLSVGLDGASGRLVEEEELTALQSSIDSYLAFLTTGMDTGEYQTNLQNALDSLQLKISILK